MAFTCTWKSTFIDYYYYCYADVAMEINMPKKIREEKPKYDSCVRFISLFNESTENIVWILKCQKLFMKLSFNEKCENNLSEQWLKGTKKNCETILWQLYVCANLASFTSL